MRVQELLQRIINWWYVDSGCSRHMTGERSLLTDLKTIKGSYVSFASAKGGNITGMGVVTNGKITLEKVNYVEQLKHDLMSVSQIFDKGNSVLFTTLEALILKPGFVIPEEWIVMRAARKNDTYVIVMSVSDPSMKSTCLLSRDSELDSLLWHRRMTHLNFRKMNFITKNGLVQGVALKIFAVDDKCLPCKMGKQHRKSHMSKHVNSISSTFELLHINLFGPVKV